MDVNFFMVDIYFIMYGYIILKGNNNYYIDKKFMYNFGSIFGCF